MQGYLAKLEPTFINNYVRDLLSISVYRSIAGEYKSKARALEGISASSNESNLWNLLAQMGLQEDEKDRP